MAEARRLARPTLVHQGIMRVHSRWLEHTGVRIPHFDVPQAVHDIYPDLSHALDWEQAIAATSFVPDEVIAQLADALGLVGTPEHCAKRIIDLAGAGVSSLYLMGFQTFVGPERRRARRWSPAASPSWAPSTCWSATRRSGHTNPSPIPRWRSGIGCSASTSTPRSIWRAPSSRR